MERFVDQAANSRIKKAMLEKPCFARTSVISHEGAFIAIIPAATCWNMEMRAKPIKPI